MVDRQSQWREILSSALNGTLAAQGQTWLTLAIAASIATLTWVIQRRARGEAVMSLPEDWKALDTWAPIMAGVTVLALVFIYESFKATGRRDAGLLAELKEKDETIAALRADLQRRNVEVSVQGAIIGEVAPTPTSPAKTSFVFVVGLLNRGPATVLIAWQAWLKSPGSDEWKRIDVIIPSPSWKVTLMAPDGKPAQQITGPEAIQNKTSHRVETGDLMTGFLVGTIALPKSQITGSEMVRVQCMDAFGNTYQFDGPFAGKRTEFTSPVDVIR